MTTKPIKYEGNSTYGGAAVRLLSVCWCGLHTLLGGSHRSFGHDVDGRGSGPQGTDMQIRGWGWLRKNYCHGGVMIQMPWSETPSSYQSHTMKQTNQFSLNTVKIAKCQMYDWTLPNSTPSDSNIIPLDWTLDYPGCWWLYMVTKLFIILNDNEHNRETTYQDNNVWY